MSAFICSPEHFVQLAVFATRRAHGSMNVDPRYLKYDGGDESYANKTEADIATYYANILYDENIRSVSARYPNDKPDKLPGPITRPARIQVRNRDTMHGAHLHPVDILKMCDCLEYQSCETDDYRNTLGFKLLDRIRGAAIHTLPGYENAPWEYTTPDHELALLKKIA